MQSNIVYNVAFRPVYIDNSFVRCRLIKRYCMMVGNWLVKNSELIKFFIAVIRYVKMHFKINTAFSKAGYVFGARASCFFGFSRNQLGRKMTLPIFHAFIGLGTPCSCKSRRRLRCNMLKRDDNNYMVSAMIQLSWRCRHCRAGNGQWVIGRGSDVSS